MRTLTGDRNIRLAVNRDGSFSSCRSIRGSGIERYLKHTVSLPNIYPLCITSPFPSRRSNCALYSLRCSSRSSFLTFGQDHSSPQEHPSWSVFRTPASGRVRVAVPLGALPLPHAARKGCTLLKFTFHLMSLYSIWVQCYQAIFARGVPLKDDNGGCG